MSSFQQRRRGAVRPTGDLAKLGDPEFTRFRSRRETHTTPYEFL